MSNKPAFNSRFLLGITFAVLTTVSGLASCGGGGGSATPVPPAPAPTAKITIVSTSATPAVITSGLSAVIAWSSVNSTSCSSSNGMGGTGTTGSFSTPALFTNTTYTITCGSASQSVMVAVANTTPTPTPTPTTTLTPTLNAILSASTAWATTPVRGTVHYYCDCGTGADPACKPGNDTNAGTTIGAPKQTIGNAITQYNALTGPGLNTFAFCQGGAFNVQSRIFMNNSNCPAGAAGVPNTCTDFREYPAQFTPTNKPKPIINNMTGDNAYLFSFQSGPGIGGVRFLNLKFQGDVASLALNTEAIFIYGGAHDITVGNVTIDSFALPFNHNSGGANTGGPNTLLNPNVTITGNTISNSASMGYLGGGPNAEVSYNYWDGNGSSNMFDHTIYLSGGYGTIKNVNVVGNYIHGQYGSSCKGVVLTVHGQYDQLKISNNTIDIEPASFTGGCYGLSVGSGGYPTAASFTNVTIAANTIRNGGNQGIGVANCSDCFIQDNVIAYDVSSSAVNTRPTAIVAATDAARTTPSDNLNTRTTISNNTIWVGPNAIGGVLGIQVALEGTGYIVANNTVNYASTNVGVWGGIACYDYPLPLTSYTFINNNHCNSAASTYTWGATSVSSLAAWKTYAGTYGYDSASKFGAPTNFVNSATVPYDFHPSAGSILLGAGAASYVPATDITDAVWSNPPAIGAYE